MTELSELTACISIKNLPLFIIAEVFGLDYRLEHKHEIGQDGCTAPRDFHPLDCGHAG